MVFETEVQDALAKAQNFVSEGVKQILSGNLDERHGVSSSPGATALATLALLALGRGFETAQQQGVRWLQLHYHGGWGKFPGDKPDEEITQLAGMVLQGSQGGWKAKLRLLAQARQFSDVILSLGCMVPGLEGPTQDEILFPNVLEERVLAKLPFYGRPVIVAASLLGTTSSMDIHKGLQYLMKAQMTDGSWSEDIIATSLSVLALMSKSGNSEQTQRAGRWLVQKQYTSGGWPAFDQLENWVMGWALGVFSEITPKISEIPWLKDGVDWLQRGQNADGSYGSTPPFTHPDLDDTAVALIGLHQMFGEQAQLGVNLLRQLQNDDGSWGTFPSFQGIPPHISSEFPVYIPSVDVSIHVLEALGKEKPWQDHQLRQGVDWILTQQNDQGAFQASWFEGPIYCTAQVVDFLWRWKFSWKQCYTALRVMKARKNGIDFLINAQNDDGSWGSIVDTSLAIAGLLNYEKTVPQEVFDQGIRHILSAQLNNGSFEPSYGGIYAKGWNYEEPLTTALTAIRALHRHQRWHKGSSR